MFLFASEGLHSPFPYSALLMGNIVLASKAFKKINQQQNDRIRRLEEKLEESESKRLKSDKLLEKLSTFYDAYCTGTMKQIEEESDSNILTNYICKTPE
jgi:hypothetical protein